MRTTEEYRSWWVLFPVRGLTLDNRTHDLERPLFGDATFLSARHLRTLGRKSGLFAMHDIIKLLPNEPMRGDTYLAVCRRASITASDDDAVYDALIMQAKERAEQLIAALAVMIFAQRADGTTIGLLEQSYSRFQFLSIFEREHDGWSHSMNGMDAARTIPRREQIVWTRRELRQWLRNPWWHGLVASAINPSNVIPRSFRNTLTQASIRLAEAYSSPTRSTQLIGAVTALEVLLSYTNQGTGFSTIEQRIDALLGSSWATRLRVKDVFHARHSYVHQGTRITESSIVEAGLVLAVAVMMLYSHGLNAFADKNALLAYLDVSIAARRCQPTAGQRPLVHLRPIFPPLPDELPMLALLAEDRSVSPRFLHE